jgi:hypothetical protein
MFWHLLLFKENQWKIKSFIKNRIMKSQISFMYFFLNNKRIIRFRENSSNKGDYFPNRDLWKFYERFLRDRFVSSVIKTLQALYPNIINRHKLMYFAEKIAQFVFITFRGIPRRNSWMLWEIASFPIYWKTSRIL